MSIDGVTCGNQMSRFTAFVTKKVTESIRRRKASSFICVFGEASAQGLRPDKINWTAVGRRHLFLYGHTKVLVLQRASLPSTAPLPVFRL